MTHNKTFYVFGRFYISAFQFHRDSEHVTLEGSTANGVEVIS